jgi:hypothetical protein
VVVSLDVQQDVVPVEKAELKCADVCSCGDYTNSPDQPGDDTRFDGIFEEQ